MAKFKSLFLTNTMTKIHVFNRITLIVSSCFSIIPSIIFAIAVYLFIHSLLLIYVWKWVFSSLPSISCMNYSVGSGKRWDGNTYFHFEWYFFLFVFFCIKNLMFFLRNPGWYCGNYTFYLFVESVRYF